MSFNRKKKNRQREITGLDPKINLNKAQRGQHGPVIPLQLNDMPSMADLLNETSRTQLPEKKPKVASKKSQRCSQTKVHEVQSILELSDMPNMDELLQNTPLPPTNKHKSSLESTTALINKASQLEQPLSDASELPTMEELFSNANNEISKKETVTGTITLIRDDLAFVNLSTGNRGVLPRSSTRDWPLIQQGNKVLVSFDSTTTGSHTPTLTLYKSFIPK